MDTEKTRAALVTELADNSTGEITPQTLRDLLASVDSAYGGLYISTPAAVTMVASATDYLVGGVTTLVPGTKNFTMPSNMRLTSGSTSSRWSTIRASFTMSTDTAGTIYKFSVYKNGVKESGSEMGQRIAAGVDPSTVSLEWSTALTATDYIEIMVQDPESSGSNLTCNTGSVHITTQLV